MMRGKKCRRKKKAEKTEEKNQLPALDCFGHGNRLPVWDEHHVSSDN